MELTLTPEERLDIFAALQVVLENYKIVASFGTHQFDEDIIRISKLVDRVEMLDSL